MKFFGLLPDQLEHNQKHQQISDNNTMGTPIEADEELIPFNAEPFDGVDE